MDMFDDDGASNAHEYTVSEISGAVKRVIEGEFGRVRVRGEVGRVSTPRSGHVYFDIKDDRSTLASVTWKGQVAGLAHRPEEGMEVVATGKLTTFGSQSKYQLNVDDLRPAGVGALMAMLEARKKALEAEGLFAAERKAALPFLPEVIGVVTSPSGAVIRDILHRLRERFPRKVLVWPVAVQGRDCAPQVARAIRGFNAMTPGGAMPRPDLLIVARGGGSIEDLWGFNEEAVARAASESTIPLISAVGHETDTTLIDFVSDRRAPTPSAAAEMAVPVRLELLAWTEDQGARLRGSVARGVTQRGQRLRDLARALPRPEALTAQARQRLDVAEARLPVALRGMLTERRARLAEAGAVLRPRALRQRLSETGGTLERLAARLAPALGRGVARRQEALELRAGRLAPAMSRRQAQAAREAALLGRRLSDRPLRRAAAEGARRLDGLSERLDRAFAARGREARDRLAALARVHESLGYEETLRRGYAVVWSGDRVVTTLSEAQDAAGLEIQFQDGRLPLGGSARKPKRKPPPPEQGSLL